MRIRTVLLTASVIGLLDGLALTQALVPLSVEDGLRTRRFAGRAPLQFSPDGKWLAYTMAENTRGKSLAGEHYALTGVSPGDVAVGIFLLDMATGQTRNLTGGLGNNFSPVWSPDGRYLAFVSDRDGSSQAKLWVWDSANQRIRKVSDLTLRLLASDPQWMPNSRQVLVSALPQGMTPQEYAERLVPRQDPQRASAESVTATVIASPLSGSRAARVSQSDPWNLDQSLRDLVLVDVISGRSDQIVHQRRIDHYELSPDGSRVALTSAQRFETPGSTQIVFDLTMIPLTDRSKTVAITDLRLGYLGPFTWSPDSTQLAYKSTSENGDCFVIGIRGGPPRNITNFTTRTSGDTLLWDATGARIYFRSNGTVWTASLDQRKAVEFTRMAGRQLTLLATPDGRQIATVEGGKAVLVFSSHSATKEAGFYLVALDTGNVRKCLRVSSATHVPMGFKSLRSCPKRRVLPISQAMHNMMWICG